MKQSCKTCRWAEFRLTNKGRIIRHTSGKCKYPPTILPTVPECETLSVSSFTRYHIWPDDGKRCPVFTPKPAKPKLTGDEQTDRHAAEFRLATGE